MEHLLWQAANPEAKPAGTVVLGTESLWRIAPVAKPLPVLEQLLRLYWAGLREPLKFFPASSYAFAAADFGVRHDTSGRTVKQPIEFALDRWNGKEFDAPGECKDEYTALFFRNNDPLDGDFEDHARTVFDPLLAAAEEIEG